MDLPPWLVSQWPESAEFMCPPCSPTPPSNYSKIQTAPKNVVLWRRRLAMFAALMEGISTIFTKTTLGWFMASEVVFAILLGGGNYFANLIHSQMLVEVDGWVFFKVLEFQTNICNFSISGICWFEQKYFFIYHALEKKNTFSEVPSVLSYLFVLRCLEN